MTFPGFDSAIL